jgi:simple sugar transport system ATP-binding protein
VEHELSARQREGFAEIAAPAVRLAGIEKVFGVRPALAGADFSLAWGEVHALLGENGAGKSTLMNVLAGFYTADAGVMMVDGVATRFETPAAAAAAGIGMIHQHFKLVGPLSVIENLRLSCARRAGWKTRAAAIAAMNKLSAELGFKLNPKSRVDELAVSDRQKLEIMKVLLAGAKILIMDEPTAVLTEAEAQSALGLARQLAQGGRAVVLITHKLRDVLGYSDRVTVMRGGKTVLDGVTSAGMDAASLARAMMGAEPDTAPPPRAAPTEMRELLRLINLSAPASEHGVALHGINLDLRRGEILGIAGVGGNGQAELVETLVGMRRAAGGSVLINEVDAPSSPLGRREAGLRCIPADRMGMGLFGTLSVGLNLAIPRVARHKPEKTWWIGGGWVAGLARAAIASFEVAGADADTPSRLLSGGNAQKLMLAREFEGRFAILIAHSPTRGLDIRAVQAVQARLRKATEGNAAVLLISEDLDEIFGLSDRIAVLSHGRLSEAKPAASIDRAQIGRLMLEMA